MFLLIILFGITQKKNVSNYFAYVYPGIAKRLIILNE